MPDQRIDDLDETLNQCRGGVGSLWGYSPSLSELSLRVTWHGTRDNIHLMCNGCTRIEALTTWSNVNLVCYTAESGEVALTDANAGFRVLCRQVRAFRNVPPLFEM